MKYFVVLLALLGSLAMGFEIREVAKGATPEERSVASIIVDVIYAIRDQMPCGFPALGIPALAPLVIEHKEINYKSDTFSLDAEIDNFSLNGLDDFEVLEFKASVALGKLSFSFKWNNINLSTKYKVHAVSTSGLKIDAAREGNAVFGIKDITFVGSAKYNLGLNNGDLNLSEFLIYINIGEVTSNIDNLSPNDFVNRMLNDIIEEWFNIAINDYTDEIAQVINDSVVPLVNDLIDGRSLQEIVEGLTGGNKGVGKIDCRSSVVAA